MTSINDKFTSLGNSIINLVNAKTPIATTSKAGLVKPDGETILVDNGAISVPIGSENIKGIVQLDGDAIGLDDDGKVTLKREYLSQDLSNLAENGTKIIKYLPFTVNNGPVNETKYVEEQFVQPVMSGNGLLGGKSFACKADSEYTTTTYRAWHAFDGSHGAAGFAWLSASGFPHNLIFYNPDKIKVTTLDVVNINANTVYAIKVWKLYGSNNNKTWTQLANGTNSTLTKDATWTITVPANKQNYYNYYKIYTSEGSNANCAGIAELKINATVKKLDEKSGESCVLTVPEAGKDQYNNGTNPYLSANGTLGADDFAVTCTSTSYINNLWRAFDDGEFQSSTYYYSPNGTSWPFWVTFYFNNPVLLDTISWVPITFIFGYKDAYSYNDTGYLSYSDDNVTWTKINLSEYNYHIADSAFNMKSNGGYNGNVFKPINLILDEYYNYYSVSGKRSRNAATVISTALANIKYENGQWVAINEGLYRGKLGRSLLNLIDNVGFHKYWRWTITSSGCGISISDAYRNVFNAALIKLNYVKKDYISTQDSINIASCDLTTADGKSYFNTSGVTSETSELASGTYAVFKNVLDDSIVYSSSFSWSKFEPGEPSDGDYWLSTSKTPYTLYCYDESATSWVENNELVYLGKISVDNGVPEILNNVDFNYDYSGFKEYPHLIDNFRNGPTWRRIYSDGWCECGDALPASTSWLSSEIVFDKKWADTNYSFNALNGYTTHTDSVIPTAKTNTSITVMAYNNTGTGSWFACGYLAEGEY